MNLQPSIRYPFLSINTTPTHLNCSPSQLFYPQSASKLCSTRRLAIKTTQISGSLLELFTNYGFSNSQVRHIVTKEEWLLSCNLSLRVLQKFLYFLSKGFSNSDIVTLVTKNPRVLSPSLDNHIALTYELLYTFLRSDKDVIASVLQNPNLLCQYRVPPNLTTLIQNGVSYSNIAEIIRSRTWILQVPVSDMQSLVEELKDMGFNPTKITFVVALKAKTTLNKTMWEEKVDVFKKWGWSDEDVIESFKKQPSCMLNSIEKINLVMDFWVNQLGWDPLALTKQPRLFSLSLEKRIIPRASVVQFLLNNGLRNKNASLTHPFVMADRIFLDRYIKCFEKESSYLLKLYDEKRKLPSHD